MSDKEQLIALRNRIDTLQKAMQEQNELICQYEAQGNAADMKLAALSQVHQDKVRNLMNSIQVLKKENAQLKSQGKEHKRSQLIEQLNQEIKEQDLVIDVLREAVGNEQRCDAAIVKALNAGPPKIKSLSREELKIEVKNLKQQVLKLKEPPKVVDNASVASSASTKSNQSMQAKDLFDQRIAELQSVTSELKSQVGALEEENAYLNNQLNIKSKEVTDLKEARTNLIILNKKYEVLQAQLEQYRKKEVGQQFEDINKELDFEEQKIINKAQGGKLQAVEKNMKFEMDTLNIQKEQAMRELELLKDDYSKLNKKFNTINAKNEQLLEELNKTKAELKTKIVYYEGQIQTLLTQQAHLQNDIIIRDDTIKDANMKIEEQNETIQQLQQGIRELEVDLQRMDAVKKQSDKTYDIEINKKIQGMLKQQYNDDPDQLKNVIKQQQNYYEEALKTMQKKLVSADRNFAEQLSDISSNISGLVQQQGDNMDAVSSNVSDFQQQERQEIDSNIEQVEIPSDMDSSISQLLQQAPKQNRKQIDSMDSSVGSMASKQSQKQLNDVSSNISDQVGQLSKISSNLSGQSFTSSMKRQVYGNNYNNNKNK